MKTELEIFLESTTEQAEMARMLNKFARLCAAQAHRSGFGEEPAKIQGILGPTPLGDWFESCELQAELARIGSEIGEAIEGIRKPHPDTHLPQHSNFLVELGDTLIRIGDTTGRRTLPIGEATVAKMVYNASRPKKHGKGS